MKATVFFVVFMLLVATKTQAGFPDSHDVPPKGWNGQIFELSQDYPAQMPQPEEGPWMKFDPRIQWQEYLKSVLSYCYEGNVDVDWVVQKNPVRKWYHTPWLHYGINGREFIHGLTNERPSQPGELGPKQITAVQNWAVGFYNAPGGYVLGQVWKNPDIFDESPASHGILFPVGTVSCKLLFTQATLDQAPYLKGSPEWKANIFKSMDLVSNPGLSRSPQEVRLLQIDVAVRDPRVNDTTGWVFGTFAYSADAPGTRNWDRVLPIGLMWGNDPLLTPAQYDAGKRPTQSIPSLRTINDNPAMPHQHLGWLDRLDGPVDNPKSACLSCHSTSEYPVDASLVPTDKLGRPLAEIDPAWMQWFRNIKGSESFTAGDNSLDYSLQLTAGLRNYFEWKRMGGVPPHMKVKEISRASIKEEAACRDKPVSRDGR